MATAFNIVLIWPQKNCNWNNVVVLQILHNGEVIQHLMDFRTAVHVFKKRIKNRIKVCYWYSIWNTIMRGLNEFDKISNNIIFW